MDINFDGLDNLVKKMGATVKDWDSGKSTQDIQLKPIDTGTKKSIREALEQFEIDKETGILYKDGVPWILYIKAPKDATIEELKNTPKESKNTPRYHITGDCSTIETMKRNNRYDRYVFDPNIEEKFEVFGYKRRSKWWGQGKPEIVKDVELGVCYNCLKRAKYKNIGRESTTDLKKNFNVEKWFKDNVQEKFLKPKFSYKNYPDPIYNRDFYTKSSDLKFRRNWTCENCGLEGISHKRLIHCDHIDGNPGNNNSSNLRLVCVDCHRAKGQNKSVGSNADYRACLDLKRKQNKVIYSE